MEELIVVLPNYSKSFEIQTHTSDYNIGGVHMKEGYPVA